MTGEALVAIEADSQAGGVCFGRKICHGRIDKRAQREITAVIANRLQLDRPLQAFVEHGELDGCESIERRARAWRTGANAGVLLGETRRSNEDEDSPQAAS